MMKKKNNDKNVKEKENMKKKHMMMNAYKHKTYGDEEYDDEY